VEALVYARCAEDDRDELVPQVAALGARVEYVPGSSTAVYALSYDGDRREIRVDALGDAWTPADVPALPDAVTWVHVAPLARSDFPAATLATLARGRRVSFDGQGLVRVAATGALRLDAAYDAGLLEHVSMLKLNDEEAEVLGDPAALGVEEVIVTHGSRGATLYASGATGHVPAVPLGADPTGAGDAFCVAYVAARSTGAEPLDAARHATDVVAAVLGAA
jgi:sugar/nucleoside kinase (ribokinase family)